MSASVFCGRFLLSPLEMFIRQGSAQFVELLLVVYEFLSRISRKRELILQPNCLLWTNFLTHAAVDAPQHVDLKLLRTLFDMSVLTIFWYFSRRYADGFWRTNKLTQLARNTLFATLGVFNQCGNPAIAFRNSRSLLRILQGNRFLPNFLECG